MGVSTVGAGVSVGVSLASGAVGLSDPSLQATRVARITNETIRMRNFFSLVTLVRIASVKVVIPIALLLRTR
jgi:hypothetical protein